MEQFCIGPQLGRVGVICVGILNFVAFFQYGTWTDGVYIRRKCIRHVHTEKGLQLGNNILHVASEADSNVRPASLIAPRPLHDTPSAGGEQQRDPAQPSIPKRLTELEPNSTTIVDSSQCTNPQSTPPPILQTASRRIRRDVIRRRDRVCPISADPRQKRASKNLCTKEELCGLVWYGVVLRFCLPLLGSDVDGLSVVRCCIAPVG